TSEPADKPGIKKAAGICALRPTGLKLHSYENARPANPGTSKTEPNICHWGVASVVPGEEHAGCCETTTASTVHNSLRRAQSSQYLLADLTVRVPFSLWMESTGFSYASPGPLRSKPDRVVTRPGTAPSRSR